MSVGTALHCAHSRGEGLSSGRSELVPYRSSNNHTVLVLACFMTSYSNAFMRDFLADRKGTVFRRLNAIEIAEGALLADIAVVLQLILIYLPVGGGFLRTLIFIVFAVLVLRRGLYVGIMGMCVAMFIVGVVTGPQNLVPMWVEGAGGLFLGITMKYRLRHMLLLLLGITCGALTIYCLLFLFFLVDPLLFTSIMSLMHQVYDTAIALMNLITARVGLANWWKHTIYPTVASLAVLGFTYWWILLYLGLWAALCPVVTAIYALANLFVRLLGYDVRPFPDGRLGRILHRAGRRLVRVAVKRGILKRSRERSSRMQERREEQAKQEVGI
jgi:hypothetical protein